MAPKDETKVEKNCPSVSSLSETYPNMTKEDVLKFSSTPFWNTLRLIALVGLGAFKGKNFWSAVFYCSMPFCYNVF